MCIFFIYREHDFLNRLPCVPSANKPGLGHMLAQDQSLPGHGYRFRPGKKRTIYILLLFNSMTSKAQANTQIQ